MEEITESTLSKQQIENWRRIIFLQLENKMAGAGIYATIMPDAEVIAYYKKMKSIIESPDVEAKISKPIKKGCNHSNSIVGNKGKYCITCEKYV